jgi:hypothetical protein
MNRRYIDLTKLPSALFVDAAETAARTGGLGVI